MEIAIVAEKKSKERDDKNFKYKDEINTINSDSEFFPLYMSTTDIFSYLTKSINFRQQILVQLGMVMHFLQYISIGSVPKIEFQMDDQQKQWIIQKIQVIKKRIDGTFFNNRNWKSFGLELLFRHELELDKSKTIDQSLVSGQSMDEIEEGEMMDSEQSVKKKPFLKSSIDRVFGNPPTLEELKQKAERFCC